MIRRAAISDLFTRLRTPIAARVRTVSPHSFVILSVLGG